MENLTADESKLLQLITNNNLKTSLTLIRGATEKIWAADAPRIIQDYTDHGIKHCERLAYFASKLLEANDGIPLSNQEMYLLLAGIYLHDIGMQCDVVTFPAIKAQSEAMGAQFDRGFTAQLTSGYSVEEQKAIRKNHHLLSVAWIDHAYRTGETVLGTAARSIPRDLVDELIGVCKHHTKLPIADCPVAFNLDPTGRKQLIAALLRFSDELDIDGRRVSIETVKNFSLSPSNSVYWWLHHNTRIIFSAKNVIDLNIILTPHDVEQCGTDVYDAFITEFQTKNRPVLSILAKNGIPFVINHESRVIAHNRADPLPPEIIQLLKKAENSHNPLMGLANEVQIWLRAIRYEVNKPEQQNERAIDLQATLYQGSVKQRVLVRCIGGEIEARDVQMLDAVLDRKTPEGWLISDKRVAKQAREQSARDDAFQVFTLAEFLMQKVWGPYSDALKALVEKDKIPDLYVEPGCYKQPRDDKGLETKPDRYPNLEEYIDGWLKERGKMHISVLGDFGAGKTWFCRYYAYKLMKRYFDDPVNQRMPLLITLRTFTKSMTAQQLINDALLEQYKLPFVGSAFEIFQEMNRRGKLLLILDGFDEMARQVDYQTVVDNFWELAELVDEQSKVILTSRTEYFRWAQESEKILGGEEFGRHTIVLQPPKFEVVYLEPFNDGQIKEVITRRLGIEEGGRVAERILKNKNLAEMARKPVLIELLLAALDEVSPDVLENPTQVYLYATNKLLLRNITAEKTFTSTSDKLYFLCELAWEMIKTGELRIHYTAIPTRIKSYFGDRIKDQHELDTWDFDLRSQTLLHRNVAGYYEFAHKSLAEYFVAFKFAVELGCLASAFSQTYCEATGNPCALPFKQKNLVELRETFGSETSMDVKMQAVYTFLREMLSDNLGILNAIILETKGKTFEEVRYTGGNALTLLKIKDQIVNEDWSETVLAGADLSNFQRSSLNLRSSDLYKANLIGCRFSEDTLKNARLQDNLLRCIIIIDAKTIRNVKNLNKDGVGFIVNEIRKMMHSFGLTTETWFLVGYNNGDAIVGGDLYTSNLDIWGHVKGKIASIYKRISIALYDNEINEIREKVSNDLIDNLLSFKFPL